MGSHPKTQFAISSKIVVLTFLFLVLLLLIARSTVSPPPPPPSPVTAVVDVANSQGCPPQQLSQTCSKAPPSLAKALVHYATTNVTPQQTFQEVSVSLRVLINKSPCNFLVFGLGHDSLMWSSLNHGGRTVFLEEDDAWIRQITEKFPSLEAYHVQYPTKVHQSKELMKVGLGSPCQEVSDPRFSQCTLSHKGFPEDIYDVEWDLIMVDAPTGFHDEAPGRMTAIYTAGLFARNRGKGETHVFVHDVNRVVEDEFSRTFLCEAYLTEQVGLLRHFTIPSHKEHNDRPFCPPPP